MQIETLAISGEAVDPTTRASSPNLVMPPTFLPRELTGFSALYEDESAGDIHARSGSPTVRQPEEKLAALDGAEAARCLASELSATHPASLGHLRSMIYWIGSDDILKSTYQHGPQAEARFRALTAQGIFRPSVGLEHATDICADLEGCL